MKSAMFSILLAAVLVYGCSNVPSEKQRSGVDEISKLLKDYLNYDELLVKIAVEKNFGESPQLLSDLQKNYTQHVDKKIGDDLSDVLVSESVKNFTDEDYTIFKNICLRNGYSIKDAATIYYTFIILKNRSQ